MPCSKEFSRPSSRWSDETAALNLILVVGAPLQVDSRLFNCGIVLYRGRILGVAVKSYLPNYREFYEGRQFSPAEEALAKTITLCGQEDIPFGADLIFDVTNIRTFPLLSSRCARTSGFPFPPPALPPWRGPRSSANLSASNVTIGKVGIPPELDGQPVRTLHLRLSLRRGGPRGIDDGSGLGRSCHDLRKRQPPGGIGTVLRPLTDHPGRYRSRPSCPGPDAPDQLRPECADPSGSPPEVPAGDFGD